MYGPCLGNLLKLQGLTKLLGLRPKKKNEITRMCLVVWFCVYFLFYYIIIKLSHYFLFLLIIITTNLSSIPKLTYMSRQNWSDHRAHSYQVHIKLDWTKNKRLNKNKSLNCLNARNIFRKSQQLQCWFSVICTLCIIPSRQ